MAKAKTSSKSKPAAKKTAAKKTVKKTVSDWKTKALAELKKYTGNKDLKVVRQSNPNECWIEGESGEYRVFETHEDAVNTAEIEVENMLKDEPEIFNKDWLIRGGYVYVTDTDKRIIADEESTIQSGNMSDREIAERMGVEAEYDEAEANDDQQEMDRIAQSAREDFESEVYDEWYKGLDKDPIKFLSFDQGMYTEEEAFELSFINVDSDKAAKAAVEEDGVAHFLATYDGDEIELPGGYYAYRTN